MHDILCIRSNKGVLNLNLNLSGMLRAAPQRPVAKQRWGMLSPCAQNLRVKWPARYLLLVPIGSLLFRVLLASILGGSARRVIYIYIYSFAKTDLLNKKVAIEHRHINWQKGSCVIYGITIDSLWPGDAIWRHRNWSISTHLMAFCLTAQAIT